jgi:hypothetical protein
MKRKCMVCLAVAEPIELTGCCRACSDDYTSSRVPTIEWAAKRARLFARRARQKLDRKRKVAA